MARGTAPMCNQSYRDGGMPEMVRCETGRKGVDTIMVLWQDCTVGGQQDAVYLDVDINQSRSLRVDDRNGDRQDMVKTWPILQVEFHRRYPDLVTAACSSGMIQSCYGS